MKKKLAYFMACTDNLAFAAGNVALSLNKYMPNKEFDIVIYHDGFQDANIKSFQQIPNVILRKFEFEKNFVDHMLSPNGLPDADKGGRWKNKRSLFAAAHFEIFDLLDEYKTVVWLDVDMSIQADISELTKYGPLGLPKDLNWNTIWTVGDQFYEPISGYNMQAPSDCNACIVVNDELPNYEKLKSYCYKNAMKYASKLKNLDQAIFQIMLQDFGIVPKEIPWNDYCCHAHHDLSAIAKIVHFGTSQKIWNDQSYLQCYPEWFRMHLVWLSLGGIDFDRSNMSIRSIWSDLFRRLNQPADQTKKEPLKKIRVTTFGIPIYVLKQRNNGYLLKILGIPLVGRNNGAEKITFKLFDKIEIFSKKIAPGKVSYFIFGLKFISFHKYFL